MTDFEHWNLKKEMKAKMLNFNGPRLILRNFLIRLFIVIAVNEIYFECAVTLFLWTLIVFYDTVKLASEWSVS